MPARYLLALANVEGELRRMLGVFATANHYELVAMTDTSEALTWLDQNDPAVLLFDASIAKAEKACHKVRAKKTLFGSPIIAISSDVTDVYVAKLFGIGADDVVPPSAGAALVSRLKGLPPAGSLKPPPDRGRAVVADADRGRCDVIARVLTNAGYDVRQAHDRRVLEYYASHAEVLLFVLSAELIPPRGAIEQARQGENRAAWVVLSPKRDLDALVDSLADLERVRVTSAQTPPEDVLFLTNELTSDKSKGLRRSPRVLHGTVVAYRTAGAEHDEFGFSYNVSRNGVYVRTLAAPESDQVWLELRPPRGRSRVRLQGRVAWRRPFGAAAGATAPAGFGVELVHGLGEGLDEWMAAYDSFVGPRLAAASEVKMVAAPTSRRPAPSPESRLDEILELDSIGPPPKPSPYPGTPQVHGPLPPLQPPPAAGRGKTTMVGLGTDDDATKRAPPPLPPIPPLPANEATPAQTPSQPQPAVVPPPKPAAVPPPKPVEAAAEETSPAKPHEGPPPKPLAAKLPDTRPLTPAPVPAPVTPESGAPARRRRAVLLVVAVSLVAGAAAAIAMVGGRAESPSPSERAPVAARETVAAPALMPAPAPTPAPSPTPAASEATAAPSAAPPGAASGTPQIVDPGGDPTALPKDQGFLIVQFSGDANVYINGRRAGATNTKLTVQCGTRFLRVGEPFNDSIKWLSVGRTVKMACQDTTSATFERNENAK